MVYLSGDAKLCSQDAALYTLTATSEGLSKVVTSVEREINPDIFCVQSANCKCKIILHEHNCANSVLIMISWTLVNIVPAACFIQEEAASFIGKEVCPQVNLFLPNAHPPYAKFCKLVSSIKHIMDRTVIVMEYNILSGEEKKNKKQTLIITI